MNTTDTLPLIISTPTLAELNRSTNDTSADPLILEICLKDINKQLTEVGLDLGFGHEDMEIYLSLKEDKYTITTDKVRDLFGLYVSSLLKCQAHQRQKIALIDVEIHELEKIIKELKSKTGKELRRKLKETRQLALESYGKTSKEYIEASTAEEATLKEYHERLKQETEATLLKDRRVVLKKSQREFILSRGKRMEKFKDTLQSIQIPVFVTRKEPENPREPKKKPKNIGIRIAAAVAVIVGWVTFMKPSSTQNSPNGQKNIPDKVDTSKLEWPKFATNFGPIIIPAAHYIDDSKRLADINRVLSEARFPTELPETVLTDETLKTDLLTLFTQNMKDEMPDYIYNERSITGTLIKEQRFNWDDMTTEIDIMVRTRFHGEIRITKKAKLIHLKDWKWKW